MTSTEKHLDSNLELVKTQVSLPHCLCAFWSDPCTVRFRRLLYPGRTVTIHFLCMVWQPFDEDYLNHLEPPVKHMSFHAYIRKLTGGADK